MVKLTGDLIEPWVVENPLNDPDDPDNPRSETYVGGTGEDIEIERDPNVADWSEHMNEYQQSREMQESGSFEITFLLDTTLDNLLDAELYREDTENGIYVPTKNLILDGMEFDIWDQTSDTDPTHTYRCLQVRPQLSALNMPIEDKIEIPAEFHLMGAHGWVVPEA